MTRSIMSRCIQSAAKRGLAPEGRLGANLGKTSCCNPLTSPRTVPPLAAATTQTHIRSLPNIKPHQLGSSLIRRRLLRRAVLLNRRLTLLLRVRQVRENSVPHERGEIIVEKRAVVHGVADPLHNLCIGAVMLLSSGQLGRF